MKRLCIFSFFNSEGRVYGYVKKLLAELATVSQRVIIVVNGQIEKSGIEILTQYSKEIYVRKNKGYDAGAYTDVVLNYLNGKIDGYDEIVLCNDTFFGPFESMQKIFYEMEKHDIDFWGLNYIERKMLSHIQSFFYVFRNSIISSGDLLSFFVDNSDLQTEELINIYGRFEVGLFDFLVKRKYRFDSYSKTGMKNIYCMPDECIVSYGLPLLKKKFFTPDCFDEKKFEVIINYLTQNTEYDVDLIFDDIENRRELFDRTKQFSNRKIKEMEQCKYTLREFENLIEEKNFYLYGTGILARDLFFLVVRYMRGFQGFVVSDEKWEDKSVLGFPVKKYTEIDKNEMVILAVSKKNEIEIKQAIGENKNLISIWE